MKVILSKPFNLVAFNLMWFGCVIGREQTLWLVGPAVLAYTALLIGSGSVRLMQIALPVAIGISADSMLTAAGLFQFESTVFLLPLWLVVLWIAFATTLTQSLHLLGRNKWIAALAGAIGLPFNYAIGERLGAVAFADGYFPTILAMSLVWACALPLLYWLAQESVPGALQVQANAPR